jgi:hypothetical protein
MTYSLDPEKQKKVDPFWRILFGKLDRLCKLQLIVCPVSSAHLEESRLTKYYKAIHRVSMQLSAGARFIDSHAIEQLYARSFLPCWLNNTSPANIEIKRQEVFRNNINIWQPRIIVDVCMPDNPSWACEARKVREQAKVELVELLKRRWEQQKGKPPKEFFQEVLNEKAQAFGEVTLKLYKQYFQKQFGIVTGKMNPSIWDLLPTPSFQLIRDLGVDLKKLGVPEKKIAAAILAYLTSPIIKEIPSVKISAALHAAVARKYCAGRPAASYPDKSSILTDITTISTLLPFCDAMTVDKQCHEFLCEGSVSNLIPYPTIIFSKQIGRAHV